MKTQETDRLLKECAIEEKCAYLPGYEQTTHYKVISECSSAYCDHLIRRGWRRFGAMFFRPICAGFIAYHHHMHQRRGWEEQPVTPHNYYTSFVQGHNDFGYEVLYFDNERLIGVDLIDMLPSGISSIYFYYDPEYANRSLGKYSLLRQIIMAQERGLPWIYLGYYVQQCQSLAYKREYGPLRQLQGRPAEEDAAHWLPLQP
ncbi:MAG: arginyltransferase [Campylobacterales bacterium]